MKDPALLLLSTVGAHFARHSGYHRLPEFLPEAEALTTARRDPAGGLKYVAAGVARKLAFTSWYLGGCAALEWQAWRRLRRGFDGVVHYLWGDADLGFLDLLLKPEQRLVATFHNCADTLPQVVRYPRRMREAAAIILMSETQRPFFLEAGVADERIHFIPHGVDTEYFQPAAVPEDFVVLSVGGYRRNFVLLRELCVALPELRFEIVAPVDFAGKFAELQNVKFFSGLNDAELLAKYHGASCLLHVAEQATANNVLLEALACGLPIVSERVGGIPEYVDESCALLAPRGDVTALTAALRQVALAPLPDLRAAARARAEALAWPKIAARTLDLYRSLA